MTSSETFEPRLAGMPVPPHVRRAGKYLLGPKLGVSPVKSIIQCLARLEGTDEYYQLKLLTLSTSGSDRSRLRDESQDEKQGKMLLHTEHSLLSLLSGMEGVVQKHDFFTEMCLIEENAGQGKMFYSGRKNRRICLVLDCLSPNDFTVRTQDLINLQHHVIREKKLSEREALGIFYNVVKIVERLHQRNVVHRDLKLGNIVLNLRSRGITLTNFCLGKHLMNDGDLLKDQRGSPAYISPDVLSGKPYAGKPSDMWALGVVLFTMLYGQFPFYDSVPQELFAKIKTAEYTIPDDGRVSEDTKGMIRNLLITDAKKRMTSSQVRDALESIIAIWRSISAPSSHLQLVPEFFEETAKEKAAKEKAAKLESAHTGLMLNLMQQCHRMPDKDTTTSTPPPPATNSPGTITVTRLSSDARPLTAEEYRMYGSMVGRLRQSNATTSSTGRPLNGSTPAAAPVGDTNPAAGEDTQLLLSARSPLLAASLRRPQQPYPPPVPAEPAVAPVPVLEQESVLDLSGPTSRRNNE